MIRWQVGETVLYRGIYKQKVWIVKPTIIMKDVPELTKLLLMPGTICKISAGLIDRKYSSNASHDPRSRWFEQSSLSWNLVDKIWQNYRFLMLLQPNTYYSVQLFWHHESNTFSGWYINFELPYTRTQLGFDTLDLELDLIVKPNYTLEWKDEAAFAAGVESGVITAEQVLGIESAKLEVLDLVARKAFPFDDSLVGFQVPVDLALPRLPEDWEAVSA